MFQVTNRGLSRERELESAQAREFFGMSGDSQLEGIIE